MKKCVPPQQCDRDDPFCRDEKECWRAIQTRDKTADGLFVYAVTTTGIYCSPSCASRQPKRENVRFFASPVEAEHAGFRPCKRCRQGRISRESQQAEQIATACRIIEQSEKTLTLSALAKAVGMSPFYFHRVFKSNTGVTPKQFAQAHRHQQMRQQLAAQAPIAETILAAGYGPNGRFYSQSSALLGMTPTAFQNKGKGITIYFAVGRCSVGEILVAESERGICAILLGDEPQQLIDELQDRFALASFIGGDRDFEQRMAQVVGFVDDPTIGLALPLDIRGTAFQQRVWQALRRIPVGETVSYRDIAIMLGSPAAVRAVAGACAANHLAVAIPCHRVVRHDGKLSGYRWGVERKRALLAKEALLSDDGTATISDNAADLSMSSGSVHK